MNERPETQNRKKKRRSVNITAFLYAFLIILTAVINLSLYRSTVKKAEKAFTASYTSETENQKNDANEKFYEAALEQYRSENDINTDIPTENNEGKLQVLKINDTICIPQSAESGAEEGSYLEVPCTGIFTVDLSISEFITDRQRSAVTVRIPQPELTSFTIDFDNAKLKNSSGIIISNGKMTSSELAHQLMSEDDPVIKETLLSNKIFSENAASAAQKIISELILAYNPYETITADVEFIS